ncbi:histidine kinase [Catenulispora yoronensis]|uniref:histidine kinase n=1 Tax=Catenulispora yoronensis TaxID=450799 RepID=A0ABP5FCK4_9ACTN
MDRLKEWLRPGTTRRDVVTTALYLLLLSPAVFVSALHRDLSAPVVGALLSMAAVPLLFRSRWPLGAVVGNAVVTVIAIAATGVPSVPPIAFAISLYSFAKRSDRRTAARVGVAAAVTITTLALALRPEMDALGENLGLIAWVGLAVAVGDASRSRRELLVSAVERAERAERTKEEEARRRVTEERMRIARELHDVVAHHITLVNAQAGVAHHLMKTDPSHAYEALERIRDTSRSALDELRATVGLLRAGDESAAPREPAPGLTELATLVDSFRHAGLDVAMEGPGIGTDAGTDTGTGSGSGSGTGGGTDHGLVPALTELTAYRIVQEALTNTHKHAGRHAAARVRVEVGPDVVRISVVDDGGRGAARSGLGTGHGMIGMQERVKAVGGTFAAGPRAGGGFRVDAELPLPALPALSEKGSQVAQVAQVARAVTPGQRLTGEPPGHRLTGEPAGAAS